VKRGRRSEEIKDKNEERRKKVKSWTQYLTKKTVPSARDGLKTVRVDKQPSLTL
jgi:hypothetical protein